MLKSEQEIIKFSSYFEGSSCFEELLPALLIFHCKATRLNAFPGLFRKHKLDTSKNSFLIHPDLQNSPVFITKSLISPLLPTWPYSDAPLSPF